MAPDRLVSSDGLMQIWGKAQPRAEGAPRYHPLAWHGLDVAAAFLRLLDIWPEQRAGLLACFDGNAEAIITGLSALVALHDLGKCTRTFQAKAPEVYPEDLLGPPRALACNHAAVGYAMAEDERFCARELDPLLAQNSFTRAYLLSPVFGHHGRPVGADADLIAHLGRPDGAGAEVARGLVARMRALHGDPVLPPIVRGAEIALSWRLAGLVALADWIGSDQRHFPYAAPDIPWEDYRRDHAARQARAAVAASGLERAPVARGDSLAIVTGGAFMPTQGQEWAADVALARNGLYILEDVTGSGKTEAALILAHRLMQAGRAGGIYVALPTMATANGLYRRLARAYRALYAPDARPSLVLAHGARDLDPAFTRSIGLADQTGEAGYGGVAGEGDDTGENETATAACTRWLADDRRRAFLAEIGVGTIDQALLAVLPVKHAGIRQLGLSRQVLIIDEAHAYDAYMQAEIEALVAHQARLGAPVIILSATLPAAMRARLIRAYAGAGHRTEMPVDAASAYPCATSVAAGEAPVTVPLAAREDLARAITITRLASPEAALETIAQAARAGAAVAYIRNSVDDAIEAARALRAAGLAVDLFHARFAMGDRLAIEEGVVARFGKGSEPQGRAGRVLVATQVVEQSLDLDFDLMITDLAPVDLMIQRAGRLWRHARGPRPVPGPQLCIVAPEPVADAPADWYAKLFPVGQYVYPDHARLWLSARAICARPAIRVPEDLRGLIEAVYAPDATFDAPEALQASADERAGREIASRAFAGHNVIDFSVGYAPASGAWGPDTLTPTREGDERVTLRLAVIGEGGALVPLPTGAGEEAEGECGDPARAWSRKWAREWSMAEIAVSAKRYRPRAGLPEAIERAAQALEERFARHGIHARLLILDPAPDGWTFTCQGSGKTLLTGHYHPETGLTLPR